MQIRLLIAFLVLLWAGPSLALSNPDGVAVIIGNKAYQGRIPEVTYAHRDADAMRHYIIDILGYDPDNIIDLRDASKAQMEAAFGNARDHKGRLWRYLDPDGSSDVVVFYSGHGVPSQKDKRGYLLPVDADPEAPEINGYPVDLLYANLAKLKEARNVLVLLEACFSGDSHQGMLIRAASGIFIKPKLPERMGKLTVLTAAQGDQLASWDEKAQHGLFTERFLRAVYGAADRDGDQQVTLSEVSNYVGKQVRKAARRAFGREQQPMIKGSKKMVLASLEDNRPSRPQLEMLASPSQQREAAPKVQAPAREPGQQAENLFWQSIQNSTNPKHFESYLQQFPLGVFAALAKSNLEALRPGPTQTARLNPSAGAAPAKETRSIDGIWSGRVSECGDAPLGATTIYFKVKLDTTNIIYRFYMAIESEWAETSNIEEDFSDVTNNSWIAAPGETEWYFQEKLETSNIPTLLSWKKTTKTSGSNIVRVTAKPPEGADPIMFKVSGARECDIKLSYKEAE